MPKRMGFIVDSSKCMECHSCEVACKQFNGLDPNVRWRKVYQLNEESYGNPTRMSVSLACNHCESPACEKACPAAAYTKREDGIVIHSQDRCIGCRMCIKACPFDAPQFNAEKGKVEKCHMCYERQDNGLEPACVATCPSKAIQLVDLNEINETDYDRTLPGFPSTNITNPSVRFNKPNQVKRIMLKS